MLDMVINSGLQRYTIVMLCSAYWSC